tara:strand:- start:1195 stop:1695 length:501 start_codon:yes stop_codon:yes gene_type:complete
MSKLKLLIEKLNECKILASELDLDPDQVSGLYGEAIALQIITEIIGDKDYKPAPPREDNIDGTGNLGTYSVKYLTPKMDVIKSSERNLIHLHPDLNFDFLTIVCDTGEVFNVPREMIVNQSEFNLSERRENNMINWMTCGSKYKVAIRPTNDNWNTLINNYLVCKL